MECKQKRNVCLRGSVSMRARCIKGTVVVVSHLCRAAGERDFNVMGSYGLW